MLTFPVDREKDFSIYFTNECGKKLPPIFLSGEGCLRYSPEVPGLTQPTPHNKTPRESRLVEFPPMSKHCSLLSLILLCHKFCCKIIFFSIFHKFYTSELSSQNSALTVYYLKYLRKIQWIYFESTNDCNSVSIDIFIRCWCPVNYLIFAFEPQSYFLFCTFYRITSMNDIPNKWWKKPLVLFPFHSKKYCTLV